MRLHAVLEPVLKRLRPEVINGRETIVANAWA
jgi:hypothetical protein